MIKVYLNYPNAFMTIHGNPECKAIQQNSKRDQRELHINQKNLSGQISIFDEKTFEMNATAEKNDVWMFIDLRNKEFEIAVAKYFLFLIHKRYSRFDGVLPTEHC